MFLDELLRLEGRGGYRENERCRCKLSLPSLRCIDCDGGELSCQSCIVSGHRANPLHRIEVSHILALLHYWLTDLIGQAWNGNFFQRVTLKSLGLRIQLNHDHGSVCLNPRKAHGDDFVILDVTGIHEVGLDYCGCKDFHPEVVQLLRRRFYPATVVAPKTAATFRLLERYQLECYEGKISVFEFYNSLSRQTENTGLNPPKVWMSVINLNSMVLTKSTGPLRCDVSDGS